MSDSRLPLTASHTFGVACVLLGTFLFACKGIFIKLAYAHGISAAPLLMLRMLFALPFYLGMAIWLHKKSKMVIPRQQLMPILGLGLVGYYLASFLDFWGLEFISAGLERLLLYIYPTVVVLILAFWKKKAISLKEMIAMAIAYVGIVFVFLHELQFHQTFSATLKGGLLVFFSAVSYAFFVVMTSEKAKQVGSLTFTTYCMLSASAGVIIHNLAISDLRELTQPAPVYWLSFGLAIFSTVIPSFLMNKGIASIGPSKAAIMGSIGPVVTVLFGAWFLDEVINTTQLIGAVLIIGGVSLVGRK
ncbi:MAG TPA: DMT family transporter [Cellvibrio sp.]|nr:DMT family transporter [Cellvibrio sp.]